MCRYAQVRTWLYRIVRMILSYYFTRETMAPVACEHLDTRREDGDIFASGPYSFCFRSRSAVYAKPIT